MSRYRFFLALAASVALLFLGYQAGVINSQPKIERLEYELEHQRNSASWMIESLINESAYYADQLEAIRERVLVAGISPGEMIEGLKHCRYTHQQVVDNPDVWAEFYYLQAPEEFRATVQDHKEWVIFYDKAIKLAGAFNIRDWNDLIYLPPLPPLPPPLN